MYDADWEDWAAGELPWVAGDWASDEENRRYQEASEREFHEAMEMALLFGEMG